MTDTPKKPTYRIDQYGPYRRWIVVQNGVDISAHDTSQQAVEAVERLRNAR